MKIEFPRIPPHLAEYVPLLSTGLQLLKSTWTFPNLPEGERRKVRMRLDDADAEDVDFLVKHTRKSREAIITAALLRAKNSHRRPAASRL